MTVWPRALFAPIVHPSVQISQTQYLRNTLTEFLQIWQSCLLFWTGKWIGSNLVVKGQGYCFPAKHVAFSPLASKFAQHNKTDLNDLQNKCRVMICQWLTMFGAASLLLNSSQVGNVNATQTRCTSKWNIKRCLKWVGYQRVQLTLGFSVKLYFHVKQAG